MILFVKRKCRYAEVKESILKKIHHNVIQDGKGDFLVRYEGKKNRSKAYPEDTRI